MSSHGPGQGQFDQFITLMNHEEAKDLVRSINLFMKSFKQNPPDADADSRAVQTFLQQMETAMAKHPLFADTSPQEQDAATEALEKYLMTKLHERTFRQGADDAERDEALAVRCEALQFVAPEHLEIPPGVVEQAHLGRAIEELNKINRYKAPRDKLVCILNCCSMINSQLARTTKEGVGADDFTPLLIYVVIKARTPNLASNLSYIERYRYHPKLTAEVQYYYIQLCGAATFIEMINASSLKVDRDEFIAHMLAAGAMTDEQLASLQSNNSADVAAAAAAAKGYERQGSGSATQQNIMRSTQAAVAAATAAGIRPGDMSNPWQYDPQQQQQQQQQQFPLQMQPLPGNGGAAGWPPPAMGYTQPAWAQQQQQQQPYGQQHGQQVPPPPPPPPQQQQQLLLPPPLPAVSELESRGAALLSQGDATAAARQLVSRHPFCCSSLVSLSLGDVGQLLAAYKELVLRYEALSAAVEDCSQQQKQHFQQYQHAQSLQQPVGSSVPAAVAAVAAGAAAVAGAAGPPPPPPLAPSTAAATPPVSTGGDGNVLPPLSPVSAAGSAEAAAVTSEGEVQHSATVEQQQQQQGDVQSTSGLGTEAAVPDDGPVASAASSAAAAVDAAAAEGQHPEHSGLNLNPAVATVVSSSKGGQQRDSAGSPSAAAAEHPSPQQHTATAAPLALAGSTTDGRQQESQVDQLLHTLLDDNSNKMVQQQEQQQQANMMQPVLQSQQQQQQQSSPADDNDLFGLFQQPPPSAGGSAASGSKAASSAGGAVVPSLLD